MDVLPLLGTIVLIYRITNVPTLVSNFETARGLFQLRVRGACVIRLAAVRLETLDHPLLSTIIFSFENKVAASFRIRVRLLPNALNQNFQTQ